MAEDVKVKKTCGIVRPIAPWDGMPPEHWADVQDIIVEALGDEFEVHVVSEADDVGVIHGRIVKNLYTMDLVICDVSGRNPNVMFEFGMRLAFDKPTIAIKDDVTDFSFDTSPLEHMIYPRTLRHKIMEKFKEDLLRKSRATVAAPEVQGHQSFLEHFGPIRVASLTREEVTSDVLVLEQLEEIRAVLNRAVASSSKRSRLLKNSGGLDGEQFMDFRVDDLSPPAMAQFLKVLQSYGGTRDVVLSSESNGTFATVYLDNSNKGRGAASQISKLYKELRAASATAAASANLTSSA